ncbi:hypothetical protein JZ751_027474 [Albula glossodonta]|uniref:Uncharacterized protein n=1 Tax=Albula glossodonta TaxID=121402 RepID=A0A8T2NBH8_9TELE|nr:hypothetical protein JZ751_027474 [Albula glossodonta]
MGLKEADLGGAWLQGVRLGEEDFLCPSRSVPEAACNRGNGLGSREETKTRSCPLLDNHMNQTTDQGKE